MNNHYQCLKITPGHVLISNDRISKINNKWQTWMIWIGSDSLKFAQITVNFDILNFRDMGSSIIVVLILSLSGRIIWKRLLRPNDTDTATLEKWDH